MDWLAGIAAQGKFDGKGNGLIFDNARVVHHDKTVTNGPFGEIKETLGGYVIIKAESADEAAEVPAAKSSVAMDHLQRMRRGGSPATLVYFVVFSALP